MPHAPVHLRRLTPLDFLERTAAVFPQKLAVVDGEQRRTYAEMRLRVHRFAHALRGLGVRPGDRVAVLAKNESTILEAHFAVPLAGAILCALNVRLAAPEIAYILEHCGATFVVHDPEFDALLSPVPDGVRRVATTDLPALLEAAAQTFIDGAVIDEDATISINYTSGTTGKPKGVMYTHRGAYLNALAEVFHAGLGPASVYLWTLPMFHCNGWCFPWAVTAAAATHVCLPKVEPGAIFALVERERVTNFCAAPTVLIALTNHAGAKPFGHAVRITTAGAPPAPTTIASVEALGAEIVHVYGLTETYGPFTVCAPQPAWTTLAAAQRARLTARQGVALITIDDGDLRVVDGEMRDVPRDGATQGEIVMRGNNVMKGYFDDPEATERAFAGGYFHSGDVAVRHPDGYIEIVDRAKDVIISGGENISTVQVEQTILTHPAVLECAVVAIPDDTWGEVPKAFVTLKPGATVSAQELAAHCRDSLPGFKVPKAFAFEELPKTSTGKIQKFVLREREWAGREKRVQ